MALAKNLRELLVIRQHHTRQLRQIPGCLGTAVGFKYNERLGEFETDAKGRRKPAILVFVREKIPLAALDPAERVQDRYHGPRGTWCHSDVIVGKPPESIDTTPPTTGINGRIVADLHRTVTDNIGGVPIEGPDSTGTAGVIVRWKGRLAALTNYHVAGFDGTTIHRTGARYSILGTTCRSILLAGVGTSDPDDLESFVDGAGHRVDIGLVELTRESAELARPGVYGLQPLGAPFRLDLDARGFAPVGTYVVGVGQKLGRQEGRILAYGYEYRESLAADADWYATDYLIKSEGELPFAAPGDSGKLVVTNDDRRQPIALLWGGEQHFFSDVPAQTTLAYATDIGLVLTLLDNAKINWTP